MARSTKKVIGEEAIHYVSQRRQRAESPPKMQPPLTPMIDVTFQLLLFFILTFTFRSAEGLIPGTLPEGEQGRQAVGVEESIYIILRPADVHTGLGVVYEMKGRNLPLHDAQALYVALQARRDALQSTDIPVVIEPGGDVLWEHVVNAFNQAVRAKFKKIGFASAS